MEKRAGPDWERIEADYRAGVLSLREIAVLHPGTNHVAIARRAKKEGWVQDLAARIKARADELVTKRTVTAEETERRIVTAREAVEANAEAVANVRLAHRSDIRQSRTLALAMLNELEAQTTDRDLFAQLGEMLRSEDDKGADKLNDIYRKVISLPGRVDSMKKLAETLKTLIGMERESFGIDDRRQESAVPTTFNLQF